MTSPIDLPITITSEIIKNSLDNDVLLSKNTKIAFSRIGGTFILFISHLANEICKSKGRSKITVPDLKEALEKAGFEDYIGKLEKMNFDYEEGVNINSNTYNVSNNTIITNPNASSNIANKNKNDSFLKMNNNLEFKNN